MTNNNAMTWRVTNGDGSEMIIGLTRTSLDVNNWK